MLPVTFKWRWLWPHMGGIWPECLSTMHKNVSLVSELKAWFSFLRKSSPMELRKGAKFSAMKAHGVKGSQLWQGRREYTHHNLRSTLNKIAIDYKSVRIGNQGDSWTLWRHGNKQSSCHEADQDLLVQRRLVTCKRGVQKLRTFFFHVLIDALGIIYH